MEGIERPKVMLHQQSVRKGENVVGVESQQCDRAIITAVRIKAIQKQAGPPRPSCSGCRRNGTREFNSCQFRRDDCFVAFEQPRQQLRMLGFIGKVGTDEGARIRVEKAQLAARSSMSA